MTEAGPQAGGVRDDPAAYVPADRRASILDGTSIPDRVVGAALFADVSGFTPLTESLAKELGPRRGAEELTAHLNRVFHAVIEEITRFGGSVIYFSGDAITCWFDADLDGRRAVAAAVALQEAFAGVNRIVTPGGQEVVLAIKVAVAVGPARRFVVGDPEIQLIDALAGRIVDDLAEAEQQAEKGEIILAPSAVAALGADVTIRERRSVGEGREVGVLESLDIDVAPGASWPDVDLPEELARPWLLPVVWERLRTGRGEFLTELRSACSVFIRFGGIDYDGEPDAGEHLDAFIRGTQAALTEYGGNLLGLTIGDKGAYLYSAFGVPSAYEDDAARACRSALEIVQLEHTTRAEGLQIGITKGRLRAGSYGHLRRHTYTCLGDSVNLAARLMAKAPTGGIYVSADIQHAAGPRFAWKPVGDFVVKGKTEPVTVVALTGLLSGGSQRVLRYPLPIVGRDRELAEILAARDDAARGHGRVVAVSAEAGRGKSRLVAEALRRLQVDADTTAVVGEAQAVARKTSYLIWRDPLAALLGVDPDVEPRELLAQLERTLAAIQPSLARRAPLLGAALGVELPDNDLTRTFDAKLRKESLETLLGDVVRHLGNERLVVVVLEDCQWIDPLSRDLLEALVRVTSNRRVLFVLDYRPAGGPGGGLGLESLPQFRELVLGDLDADATEQVARAVFRQLFGSEVEVVPELLAVVLERSGGNPFYVEELVGLIRDQGLDPADPDSARRVDLPDSLERLVLSRIDTLPEDPRRTIKVASVVGRHFASSLVQRAYPELGDHPYVERQLTVLGDANLVTLEHAEAQEWLFRQPVAREVAYESLPFVLREELHGRIGEQLEGDGASAADVDLLAHHYWHSANVPKKRLFVERAAQAAQARYANAAAIEYLERLSELVEPDRKVDTLLQLGRVLELVGEWDRARAVVQGASSLADEGGDALSQAWCEVALAEIARKQSQFTEAHERLERAGVQFAQLGDDAGVGRVLHLQGTLATQQGQYDTARDRYQASLSIRERLGDRAAVGALYSNLALVAMSEGDLDRSQILNERGLAVREDLGDPWAIAVSETNLGMTSYLRNDFVAAHRSFERSMQLAADVGDRWLVAVGHHNLGNTARGLGDADQARYHFLQALEVYETFDDPWSLVQLLEDVVPLVAVADAAEALGLVACADGIRIDLDAPRPPAVTAQLDDVIGDVRSRLGATADSVYEAARAGRLRPGELVRRALASPTQRE